MIKNFQSYFFESGKLFEFRIKIANLDMTDDVIQRITDAIDAFQVESISKPKRLPIQEHRDFGKLGPCECVVIDVAVKYPTIVEQIRQLVINRAAVKADCVCVYTKDQYLQEDEVEAKIVSQGEGGPIINNPELKDEPGAQALVGQGRVTSLIKELTDAKNLSKNFEVNGNDTNQDKVFQSKKGQTTNDVPTGTKSPVGSNKQSVPNPTKGR
jgi:hypothetical protein